jgi:two-component system nitrate/nitrite response regulator NarL
MAQVSLLLVDPNQLFREGLKRLLDGRENVIVGEVRSLRDAASALAGARPIDLVVLDPMGEDGDACAAAVHEMHAVRPGTRIVVLTGDHSRQALARAIEWGVDSYLLKDMSAEALTRSFQLVVMGQQIFPTKLMMSMMQDVAEAPGPSDAAGAARGLSPRELQILRALVNGRSNKAIARELSISEATVKVHLKALLRKVRVNNRTQAAVWALNQGVARQMPDAGPAYDQPADVLASPKDQPPS